MVTLLSSTSDLHVELLADRETRGLGVVSFHLAAIGAEQNDGLSGVRHGNAVQKAHM